MKLTLAFLLIATPALASDPSRLINFDLKLTTLDGAPLQDCAAEDVAQQKCTKFVDMTLGRLSIEALARPDPSAPSLVEQMKRYKLAQKILAGGKMALNGDELKLVEDQIGKLNFNSLAIGEAIFELDPAAEK